MKLLYLLLFFSQFYFFSVAQWTQIHHDSTQMEVLDLFFFNKDTGLVCGTIMHGEGFVMRTLDGGITWEKTNSILPICSSIDFVNDSVGYTGGQDGYIYKTSDGGVTWNWISSVAWTADLDDLEFLSESVGFAKPYHGTLYKTTDGGISWTPKGNLVQTNFYDRKNNTIHFYNDSIGFLVGYGWIYKTVDQGETWLKVNADSTKEYRAIWMLDEAEGFAVGNDGVLIHSIDSGLNWTTDSIYDQDLRDIDFINDSIGFIVGGGHYSFNDTTGIVLRTTDRGAHWETIKISDNRLNSFQFIDYVAYSTGNYGNIYKNDNFSNLLPVDDRYIHTTDIICWPIPANDEIHFNLPKDINTQIEFYDVSGRVVLSKSLDINRTINIQSIPNGFYIIKIKTTNEIYSSKVVVKHY